MSSQSVISRLQDIQSKLANAFHDLAIPASATHYYLPLVYAHESATEYLIKYGARPQKPRVLLLGMNPGPWGMTQTGVPFGDVVFVRDWMQIFHPVDTPSHEHPQRPIQGFNCTRREVSGSRLWGWAQERYGTADHFFDSFFVWNYCPVTFMSETGANVTPSKLTKSEQKELQEPCDEALRSLVDALEFTHLVGVGNFAQARLKSTFKKTKIKIPIGKILHPSPASPAANRGWRQAAEQQLHDLGITLP